MFNSALSFSPTAHQLVPEEKYKGLSCHAHRDSPSFTKHFSSHFIVSYFFNTKPNIVQPLPSVNISQPGSVTPIDRTRTGLAPLPDSDITLPLPSPIQREIAQIIINQRLNFSLEDNE
jgi:hypothetical protein